MKLKLTFFICLTLVTWGCNRYYSSSDFLTAAVCLKTAQKEWLKAGKPADFQPGTVVGTADEFFVYTNVIKSKIGDLQCRFGTRDWSLPPGMLAITDDGLVVWINDKNGKVTISPEKNGVAR